MVVRVDAEAVEEGVVGLHVDPALGHEALAQTGRLIGFEHRLPGQIPARDARQIKQQGCDRIAARRHAPGGDADRGGTRLAGLERPPLLVAGAEHDVGVDDRVAMARRMQHGGGDRARRAAGVGRIGAVPRVVRRMRRRVGRHLKLRAHPQRVRDIERESAERQEGDDQKQPEGGQRAPLVAEKRPHLSPRSCAAPAP